MKRPKKNLVVKSNSLVNAKSKYLYTKNELKVICSLIANIKKEELDFVDKTMNLRDLGFLQEDFNNHTYLNTLCRDLMSKPFQIPNTKIWVNWFSMIEIENGIMHYRFDKALKEHLLNLKEKFTKYDIDNVLLLKSTYSIALYELLKQYEKIGERTFKITGLRDILNIPRSYKTNDFKKLIIRTLKELKDKTDINRSYELKKLGRSFNEITFYIQKIKKF